MQPPEIKKFLFDHNDFDRNPEEEENAPPTFSEAELEAARLGSFEEGRKQGHAEEKASREQRVAHQVALLSEQIAALLAAEDDRESRFEQEAVRVALSTFGVCFPILNARFGVDNLIELVRQTLRDVEGQSSIVLSVPVEDVEEVQRSLSVMLRMFGDRLTLEALPSLPAGSYQMRWKDGGAVRDTAALAETIRERLRDSLAALPETLQDRG